MEEYRGLNVLGCKCFPYLKNYSKSKFDIKTYPCIFISYNSLHKGYRCLNPKTNRIYISTHVVFDENAFLFSKIATSSTILQEESVLTTFPTCDDWIAAKELNSPEIKLPSYNIFSMLESHTELLSTCAE